MQQMCYLLDVKHTINLVYHPIANPIDHKNRKFKPRLAILVVTNTQHGDKHCLQLGSPVTLPNLTRQYTLLPFYSLVKNLAPLMTFDIPSGLS